MFEDIPVFPLETPAVRPLEIIPVRAQQGEFLMVRDPMGVIEGAALLQPDPILMVFFQLADGRTSVHEMASKVTEATGQIIPAGIFESIVSQLDEALMLQSQRFKDALQKRFEDFAASDTRPYRTFQHNGSDRLAMLKELGDEMRRHKMSSLSPPKEMGLPRGAVRGVLSPHIDYKRGGETYAWAYQALKEHGTGAKTFIVLGTSHRPARHGFIATKKAYDTPFGKLPCNTEMLDELEAEFGGILYADEYLHADEHTIELNAAYLRHTFPDQDIKIIPILVVPFDEMLYQDTKPAEDDEVQKFIGALRTVLARHGDKVALIGGVDFSHCGPEFGHEELNNEARQKAIRAEDETALKTLEEQGADAFFETFRPTQNARNVCSIATAYVVTKALEGTAKPRLLHYQQATSNDQSNMVTFASVAYVKEGAEAEGKGKIILL